MMNQLAKTMLTGVVAAVSFTSCDSMKDLLSNKSANGTKMETRVSPFFYDVAEGIVGPKIERERADTADIIRDKISLYYSDTIRKANWTVKAMLVGSDDFIDPSDIIFFEKMVQNDSTFQAVVYSNHVLSRMMSYNHSDTTRKTPEERVIFIQNKFSNLTGQAGEDLNELYNGNVRQRLARGF